MRAIVICSVCGKEKCWLNGIAQSMGCSPQELHDAQDALLLEEVAGSPALRAYIREALRRELECS